MSRKIENIDEYLLFHGHQRIGDFEFSNKMGNFIEYINKKKPEVVGIPNLYTRYGIKKQAYQFFNDFYNLHKVGVLSDAKVKQVMNSKDSTSISDLAALYNSSATTVDPFKIPIRYTLKSSNDGRLKTQVMVSDDEEFNKELYPLLNIFFSEIRLPKISRESSVDSYIHEITHTQLESFKGIIEDYNNVEVVSIFNELFHAYIYGSTIEYKRLLSDRLSHLLNCYIDARDYDSGFIKTYKDGKEYNDYNYHSDIKYTISTLKALKMLALCIGDDSVSKYRVINSVNRTMSGKITVEELLEKLDVSDDELIDFDSFDKVTKAR